MSTSDQHTDISDRRADGPLLDDLREDPAGYDGAADGTSRTNGTMDDGYRADDPTPSPTGTGNDHSGTADTSRPAGSNVDADGRERLVPAERVESYGSRWDAVKGTFVDEPRQAVAQADVLVGELLEELERLFSEQRQQIEHGLDADETSTEDLRLALRRYRSFFDRLLTL